MNKHKYTVIILAIIFMFLSSVSARAALSVGQERYYGIYWADKLMGYSHYFVSQTVYMGDKTFFRINSDTRLKGGIGKIEDVQFINDMFVDQKTMRVTSLNFLQEVKDFKINLHSLFSETLIIQKDIIDKKQNDYADPIKAPVNVFINNFWGAFNTFAEQYALIAYMAKDKVETTMSVYNPLIKNIQTITLLKCGEETVTANNRKYNCAVFMIIDNNKSEKIKIYIENKNLTLVKAEQVNGAISMVIASSAVADEIKKGKGVDLWNSRVADTRFVLPRAEDLDYLKVSLSGKVFGDGIKDYKSLGFKQKYYAPGAVSVDKEKQGSGEDVEELVANIKKEKEKEKQPKDKKSSGDNIDGIFEVRTTEVVVTTSFKYPVTEKFGPDFDKYLTGEFGIESDEEEIKEKAKYIALRSDNAWSAVNRIFDWLKEEVKIGGALPSAKMTFHTKQGNSESIASLFVAMCRSLGIPARTVGGLIYSGGNFVPHTWAECYIGKDKWAPVDPSLAEIEKISAAHIALWHGGDIQNPKVKVLDFAPNPLAAVPYFKTELKWPATEKRKYSIIKDDKEIGEEVIYCKQLTFLDEKEVYEFEDTLNIDGANIKSSAKAGYYLDPFGLPVLYRVELDNGKEKLKEECVFSKNFVTKISKFGKEESQISVPVAVGLYMVDRRVIGQLVVAMGQMADLQMGNTYKLYLFSPEDLKTEIVEAKINNIEYMNVGGKRQIAFIGSTDKMNFWIDKTGKVLKLEFPEQNLSYELVSAESAIR